MVWRPIAYRGCKAYWQILQDLRGVTNLFLSRMSLERTTVEGDSPVGEKKKTPNTFLSTAGHVKSRGNLGGPPSKAKYFQRPIAN